MKVNAGNYEQASPGSYSAICIKVIDLGTQIQEWEGTKKHMRKVMIVWEIDETMKDGKPFGAARFYTASLGDKAKLRADLEGWRGRSFTQEELDGFLLQNLLGKPCMLTLVKNEKGKVVVKGVSPLPKGMLPKPQVNPSVHFSMDADEFDKAIFDSLSDNLKEIIKKSPEYQALTGEKPVVDYTTQEPPIEDQTAIPF
jgi:hypothetical protein